VGRSWNRILRTGIGIGLLVIPAWFLMPGVWSATSNQAIVNAQLVTLTSPIDGVIACPPPPVGQVVSEGSSLLQIDAPMVDQKHLEELKMEEASLTERAVALKHQIEQMDSLKTELHASFRDYKDSMVRKVTHELQEARAEAAVADTMRRQKENEATEEERLMQRGFGRPRELKQARSSAEVAARTADRAKVAVARMQDQLESMKRGVFTGPGDSRNDVPYSRQRVHEIAMQQLNCEAQLRESDARLAQLKTQLTLEEERVKQRAGCTVRAPVSGILWRHFITSGSPVAPRTELLQIANASTAFVNAAVSEKFADQLQPGDSVSIHLVGSDLEVAGKIRYIVGDAVAREDRTLAAELPRAGNHELHAIIDFDTTASSADHRDQFHIGQRVEVEFPDIYRSVLRAGQRPR
jgi:multidrug resistance efflux pump